MGRISKALLPVFTFAKIDIKRLFRDKTAIFFVFAFPLIFLFIFGTINSGNSEVSFDIAVVNQSETAFSKDFAEQIKNNKTFKVDSSVRTIDQAKDLMNRSEIDATVVLPQDFGEQQAGKQYPSGQAKVLYDQNNQQAASTLTAIFDGIFKEINTKLLPSDTPFSVAAESTATSGLTPFDYTFSGLLGFSLLSLGIFGPANVFPRLKQKGVLRRYRTTTLKVWQYFLGNVLSTAVIGMISVAIMFAVALFYFDLNMRGDYASLILLIILGSITIFGIGLAIGGWAKNENQAAPLAQAISLPLMFLSGTFFPRFILPEWLQSVTTYLPLTPIIDGVRFIVTEGKTIFEIGPQVGLLALWAVVIYAIAFRLFRWE